MGDHMLVMNEHNMLTSGLHFVRFGASNVSLATKEYRFRSHYGSSPRVCVEVWHDLQLTTPEYERVAPRHMNLRYFLMSLNFLYSYDTEQRLAARFGLCDKTVRKWMWFFLRKIQDLSPVKIKWPKDDELREFAVSVDGTHCKIQEPSHPTLSQDPSYFSHKHNHAGVSYELGMHPYKSHLTWISGPWPAATSDLTIFRKVDGLKSKIPHGKLVIADQGYAGEAMVCRPSSRDTDEVKKFKSRARARHETFNGRIKNFKCLSETFRHCLDLHGTAFVATCVLVQYQMELGAPLFSSTDGVR